MCWLHLKDLRALHGRSDNDSPNLHQREALQDQPPTLLLASTGADVLREIGLLGRPVAVEVDRNVVPYADHSTFVLEPGAIVECVTLVGGG